MKKECKNCAVFKNGKCEKGLTNFGKCHKYKTIPVSVMMQERNKLLISKDNPERLKELEEKIMYFNNGPL